MRGLVGIASKQTDTNEQAVSNYDTPVIPLAPDDLRLRWLLETCDLPVSDLGEANQKFFGTVDEEGRLLAAGGLETYGRDALVRSLAVAPGRRGEGLAGGLLSILIEDARRQDIRTLYLLTETAEGFFLHHGFETIDKNAAPTRIRAAPQFAGLCPDTATAMCLTL